MEKAYLLIMDDSGEKIEKPLKKGKLPLSDSCGVDILSSGKLNNDLPVKLPTIYYPPTQKATPAYRTALWRAGTVFETMDECVKGYPSNLI